MRVVPQAMTDAWKAALKTGDQRPVVRATVQKGNLHKFDYDTALAAGGNFSNERARTGTFTSMIFGDASDVQEIRNITNYTWTRGVDQDVATCTLTLLNTDLTPIGNADELGREGEFDLPGYFTYNRGQQTISANRWGYDTDTGWQDMLVPDRVVRTYEGYGCDPSVPAALDTNLLQSGVWLIDKVTYTHDGQITLEMRDLARLLLDQIVFPPVVPYEEYPLQWSKIESTQVPTRDCQGGSWDQPSGTATSSNNLYIGMGLTDPPYPAYVGPNGGFNGHLAQHALMDGYDQWWMSTGQTTPNSKVWWEVALNDKTTAVGAIRINPKGGPYRIYISLEGPKGWIGKKKIPYEVTTGDVDIKAGIPFVKTVWADRGRAFEVALPRAYGKIKRVRLTFSRLQDTKVGNYPWRAGLKEINLYTAPDASSLKFVADTMLKVVGNYGDYSSIVKWACAWGGFFWPPHSTGMDYIHTGNGVHQTISYAHADVALPKGRVWGDFMMSGTTGVAPLTVDEFDKKPLMDMINYIRDTLGFIFMIDEQGAVIWRLPNLWGPVGPDAAIGGLGNYLSPGPFGQRVRTRTSNFVTIDENETLLSYSTTLDSANVRERIFVANTTGKMGTVIKGFNPFPTGMRRVAGWTDQHFGKKSETVVMADMISARQMFTYRTGHVTIPGYPAIQVDDQIRIFERVTNETYYHYVTDITSTIDMKTGSWTYDLGTHWLGERPSDAWVVKVDELDQVTQAYLNTVGQVSD